MHTAIPVGSIIMSSVMSIVILYSKLSKERENKIKPWSAFQLGLAIFYAIQRYDSKTTQNKRVWVTCLIFHVKFGLTRITRIINVSVSGQPA